MLKKLLEKMAFNTQGKVITGEDAKLKIQADELKANPYLTDQEIAFILTKLRQAQYSGAEFEMFHKVWTKLTQLKG